MAKKPGGLGRDFYSLLSDNMSDANRSCGEMIRISQIEPRSDQPRKEFDPDELAALSESIAAYGVLQPIIVRMTPGVEGYYEIVAGERRWRAAKAAGLTEIPAIVYEGDDKKTSEVALVENVQRSDLNPVEEAIAYRELLTKYGQTQEELSKMIGKSRSAIANTLRLLELPDEVLERLKDGTLSAGHARALLGLEDKGAIPQLAEAIVSKGLSVREAENAVKKANNAKKCQNIEENELDPTMPAGLDGQRRYYMKDLERRSMAALGRRVRIHSTGKKRTIELDYSDDADLEALFKVLCGEDFFNA